MVKVLIQIPCWNEESTLPITVAALPTELPGVDVIETLIIDDGSTDRTVEVARESGIDHVVRLVTHQGLARAFERGLHECLLRGADIIVNTDADNQYKPEDMHALVTPILEGEADYVIGNRGVENLPHYSWIKKRLQRFGSYVVRVASNTDIPDTTSGYRALSRRAALRLSVHSDYTYTHETLIQAGRKDIPVKSVPIGVNVVTRPSRLFKSIPAYVLRSANTIVRIYLIYNAFRVLSRLGLVLLAVALACLAAQFMLVHELGATLLWASGVSFFVSTQLFLTAVLADLLAVNRRLQEESLATLRELAIDAHLTRAKASVADSGSGAAVESGSDAGSEDPAPPKAKTDAA